MLAEGEVVEEASSLDKIAAFERSCPRFRNLLKFRPPRAPAARCFPMFTFDHLHRKSVEVEFFSANDGDQLRLIHSGGECEIGSRSRPDNLGVELFRDERDIADVISMAVSGKNKIRFSYDFQNCVFVSFPFEPRLCCLTC